MSKASMSQRFIEARLFLLKICGDDWKQLGFCNRNDDARDRPQGLVPVCAPQFIFWTHNAAS